MKLERLTLSGFLRFDAPVTLNLSAIPRGLVAITGENGAGKSTLLDAGFAAAFLAFPSRGGALADYATRRDSFLEASYDLNGHVYQTRVNVDGPKRTSDAVLVRDGQPITDGKVSTFREAVAAHFPSPDLLLASAFAAQNRTGSFITLDRKGRKDLFTQLLGLAHYARMADLATQCKQVVTSAVTALGWTCGQLLARSADEIGAQLEARAAALAADLETLESDAETVGEALNALMVQLAQVRAAADAHQVAMATLAGLEAEGRSRAQQLAALQDERSRLIRAHAEAVARAAAHGTELQARGARRVQEEDATTAKALSDLDARLANNQALLADAARIRAAVTALAGFQAAVAAHRADGERLAVQLSDTHAATIRLEAALATRTRLEQQVARLADVPCGGEGPFAACGFLADAIVARDTLAGLEPVARVESQQQALTLAIADLRAARTANAADEREAAEQVQRLAPLTALAPKIDLAESRMADLQQQRAALIDASQARLVALRRDMDEALANHRTATAEAAQAHVLSMLSLDQRVEALTHEAAASQSRVEQVREEVDRTHGARVEADRCEVDIAQLRANERAIGERLAVSRATAAQIAVDRAAYLEACATAQDATRRLRAAKDEEAAWAWLAKALGRDGLPTLEIDAAGPTVSRLTNDLLAAAFGPRFTVDLVTQEDKADGKGTKESFELLVYDNASGGQARAIGDLSGGERVVVEEALRAAIALFVNSRNVSPIKTLVRDETTGALDPENATRYVAMLRRLLELGDIDHILFVTHNPDAAALADTRVVVAGGSLTVHAA